MNQQFLHFTFFLWVCLTLPLTATAQVVAIPDPNLRAAIETELGKASGATITADDMAALTRLEAPEAGISNLTGLESATNLTGLYLESNAITDISVLAGLPNLTRLALGYNAITDHSILSGLTNLTFLDLRTTNTSDLSVLSGLTKLERLFIDRNGISDLSPLAGLTNLMDLALNDNSISDLSDLKGLINLKWMRLAENNITDLSPLVANTGLGSGDQVLLNDNPLNYSSIKTHIPILQSRGVTVEFDDRTHLNVGEPRTVRLIYFLPNDRPYRADVVQRMKDEIRSIQTFYAEQMDAYGYGKKTFHVETDSQGEPMVHRVDGQHPDSYYFDNTVGSLFDKIEIPFNLNANVYLIVIDTIRLFSGSGDRQEKNGGHALVSDEFSFEVAAHELGHAFGLPHDFSDGAYIMSYGPGWNRLSPCHAEFLAVHPYFNPNTPIEKGQPPTIELISPRTYPADSKSIPVRLNASDSEGLHQIFLHAAQPNNRSTVKACRGLGGKKEAIIEFDYDGVIPSAHEPSYSISTSLLNPLVHPIYIEAIDMNGNVSRNDFVLSSATLQPLSKISGDNQRGLPNIPLPTPFVVQLQNLGASVTFTVTAGDGTLSVTHTTTDRNGRAGSTLTLGPNLGANTVEVFAAGTTVTFNAMAEAAVHIPDANLRAAVETALGVAPGNPIAQTEMATLIHLKAPEVGISNLTGLEYATNLKSLSLWGNNISNISAVAGLTKLTLLRLESNNITNIEALSGLTQLTLLRLERNNIRDIKVLTGLVQLRLLRLDHNNITDLSSLLANIGLGNGNTVDVRGNPLSYPSIHTHIPALQSRGVTVKFDNRTHLSLLKISGDNQTGVSSTSLSPFVVEVQDENGSVLGGISVTFAVATGAGTLSVISTTTDTNGRAQSTLTLGPNLGTNTVGVSAAGIQGSVSFRATSDALITEYLLSVPVGISFIHVPLKVTTVDGMEKILKSIADLYDALGGADTVNFLITYDPKIQVWRSYLGNHNRGTVADTVLANDTGIIAVMNDTVSVRLGGDALGSNRSSSITLHPGANLVGIPLRDSRIARVTDLFALDGIRGKVRVITVLNNGTFHTVGPAGAVIVLDSGAIQTVGHVGDASDIPITGGQSFILTAREAATVAISGGGWYNIFETTNILPIHTGIEVEDTTPVLVLSGSIVDQGAHVNKEGFHVTVKNFSTGKMVTAVVGDENVSRPDKGESKRVEYQLTIVDTETGRAAMIGDILEISVQSPGSSIGVEPLRYVVTAEDVLRSHIQFGELVVYEISWETELLQNYPNPFTPETWIPYRLAEDASVTLTIYDLSGHVVRTLNAGHRIAAAYESESKAIYWNGRNDMGERVASGVYFYTLTVGHYSDTRKMVILR